MSSIYNRTSRIKAFCRRRNELHEDLASAPVALYEHGGQSTRPAWCVHIWSRVCTGIRRRRVGISVLRVMMSRDRPSQKKLLWMLRPDRGRLLFDLSAYCLWQWYNISLYYTLRDWVFYKIKPAVSLWKLSPSTWPSLFPLHPFYSSRAHSWTGYQW